MLMPAPYPQTAVILAMSADGKIADGGRSPARFGSAADQAHLEAQVALADVVVFGAETLRAYGTTMSVRSPELLAQRQACGQSSQPVQLVCSASGRLDPEARFFRQPVPRWLLTTATGAQLWRQTHFDQILIAPQVGEKWDWRAVWRSLAGAGLARVAVLGGGRLTSALFEAGLVQDLWLTICPLVLGGATAPTPVDGVGFWAKSAPQLHLQSAEQLGGELFLNYRVKMPDRGALTSL
ncbi:MAG: RibD family protein [Synechococcales cyanobacterium CRU_2_2]|nr:RibD family protein [Synechococcales cyanobacterium CRU_2_2]